MSDESDSSDSEAHYDSLHRQLHRSPLDAERFSTPTYSRPRVTCVVCGLPHCCCNYCSQCGCFTEPESRRICRQCHLPCCISCVKPHYAHILDDSKRLVCDSCAVVGTIAVLEEFPSVCSYLSRISNSHFTGMLWGIYALRAASPLPRRCVMPHSALTYNNTCQKCMAPTVTLEPCKIRSVPYKNLSNEMIQRLRRHYITPSHPVSVQRATTVMRHVFPSHEECFSFHCTERPWDILLAGVAVGLAYEYKREPFVSLALSDIPYASLLVLVASGSRYTLVEGPDKTKFVSIPGTHNYRTAIADLKVEQVQRKLTIRHCPQREGDDSFRESKTVWPYRVHKGFDDESNQVNLPTETLISSIRRGYRIIFCGHSLGGAVAVLQTLRLLKAYQRQCECDSSLPAPSTAISCVTFGAPLVGNCELSHVVELCGWSSCFHHIVLYGDPVPYILLTKAHQAASEGTRILNDALRRYPVMKLGFHFFNQMAQTIGGVDDDWSQRESTGASRSSSEAVSDSEVDREIIQLTSETEDTRKYSCFGRFHFLLWDDLRYISTADTPTALSLLNGQNAATMSMHFINSYNEAVLKHVLGSKFH